MRPAVAACALIDHEQNNVTEVGRQGRPTKTITAKRITTSSVPNIKTLRATPGVEPARASVVDSWITGSELCGSAILFPSRIHRSRGQRA